MIHQHNYSTLLGSKRRSYYYPPDGSGRDSYIRIDNGGTNAAFRTQGVPELGNFMKFGAHNRVYKPASYTRFQKYTPDGSGRDKYVVTCHGGQYNEEQQNGVLLAKFRNTMRDGGWQKSTRSAAKQYHRPQQQRQMASRGRFQSFQDNRMSEPKRRCSKYSERLDDLRRTFHRN